MKVKSRLEFLFEAEHDDEERFAPLVHDALLEFAKRNEEGMFPQNEWYTAKNGVKLAWREAPPPLPAPRGFAEALGYFK